MKNLDLISRAKLYSDAFPDWPPLRADDRWIDGMWILGQNYKGYGFYGCLDPLTPVLTEKLDWVKIGELKKGDTIVGFDKNPPNGITSRRRLKKSKIIEIGQVNLPSYELIFDDGIKIICSYNHLWLSEKHQIPKWIKTEDIEIGNRIRKVCSVWSNEDGVSDVEKGWLSGMFDGEGSVESKSGIRVILSQNRGIILDRAKNIMKKLLIDYHSHYRKGREIMCDIRTKNINDTLKLIGILKPLKFMSSWQGIGMSINPAYYSIIEKRFLGNKNLIGIKTETETLVASGFASHNSYPPNYLKRITTLFPDAERVLHLFSGSLPKGDYIRCDINPDNGAELVVDVHKLSEICPQNSFDLIYADPPYSGEDADRYGTPMISRNRVVKECAKVLDVGGYLVWLDQMLPMFRKDTLHLCGVIGLVRSTNHRFRVCSIFKKVGEVK